MIRTWMPPTGKPASSPRPLAIELRSADEISPPHQFSLNCTTMIADLVYCREAAEANAIISGVGP